MVRDQLLCIVTPAGPAPSCSPGMQRRLAALCRAAGRIHFATLALLPALPGASPVTPPSLMFELVVDDGVRPAKLIELLLEHGFPALWHLYRAAWSGPRDAGTQSKREWLRSYLSRHMSCPAGGFVGLRDRSVAQILAEAKLFEATRAELAAISHPSGLERPALAQHFVEWASHSGFHWVAEPSPRSLWRARGTPPWLRAMLQAAYLVVPVLAALGALMLLGLALATCFDLLPVPRGVATAAGLGALALLAFLVVLVALVMLGMLALSVAFGVLLIAVIGMVALIGGALLLAQVPLLASMVELMGLGFLALVSVVVAALALAVGVALTRVLAPPFAPIAIALAVLALLWVVGLITSNALFAVLDALGHRPGNLPQPGSAAVPDGAWAIAALLVVVALVWLTERLVAWLIPRLARWVRTQDRPPRPTPPLQSPHQVHASVRACEAALVDRTSHMISLTEIRRPYFWHRTWLRFWLGLVTLLGHVVFTDGRLGKAEGIKFGHWHIIDNGRRFLFLSNYDGAWGGYLDEFIRGASQGVNLFWQRTELLPRNAAGQGDPGVTCARSFPPVRWFIFQGCACEQAFKAYARDSMLPHMFRFEAYCCGGQDIQRATRLRDALAGLRSADKDDQILRALES